MNAMKIFVLVAALITTAAASNKAKQGHQSGNSLKPTDWLSTSKLESLQALDEITLEQLENMPMQKGAELVQHLYHLSQINNDIDPSYVPSASSISAYILKQNGEKVETPLNQLVEKVKQEPNFGDEEVTIFITGLPRESTTVAKANRKLIQAYQQRYNGLQQFKQYVRQQRQQYQQQQQLRQQQSSSEENYNENNQEIKQTKGNLVIIDLGAKLNTFQRCAMLDVEKTGEMIGKVLVKLTNEADVPQEIIHIVAQGMAAHVAGGAAREFTRQTGHKLRRITALDPSKIFAKNPKFLTGLARGDAEFVDAIHTSAYGMGTMQRVGDVDFYPNGPSAGVPGAENLVEASMRATRYFAESVMPGKEHNFPAVAARSIVDYKNNQGYGKRAYMGIDTAFDVEGDYMLEVNDMAPFGQKTPAQKQSGHRNINNQNQNQNYNRKSNSQWNSDEN